jgi:transposase
MVNATTMTIGIDLGDLRSEVCLLDGAGVVKGRLSVATTRSGLEKRLAALPPSRVVIEVGSHSPWVSRWLEAHGHEVIVANARAVRSIAESDAKTDRSDAEQLARLGRADPQLLRPIRHRGEAAQRNRMRIAVRDHLVRTRASFVVQARGLAKGLGERLPRCKADAFARRMREKGLADLFPGLREILALVTHLDVRIAALDRELEAISRTLYPETHLLRQVPGVGPLTALTYVLTLEDPHRFGSSRTVGSYLGLRSRLRQSGARNPQLRITKAGDGRLRRLLLQCAHALIHRGPDSDLRRFGERLAARGGRAARKKAAVAVARKLAVLLHRLWITGEVYEPLHQAEAVGAV